MSDFSIVIGEWTKKADRILTADIREAVIELCSRIIRDNPVDRSEEADEIVSKGDWVSSVGTEEGDVSRNDASGAIAMDQLVDVVMTWEPRSGQPFIFANYKPYILRLEFENHSGQAPNGMMGIHVIEWDDIVAEVARKHGSA